jgi:redox-sensitive bicupin YhaK (pirin superfamily)
MMDQMTRRDAVRIIASTGALLYSGCVVGPKNKTLQNYGGVASLVPLPGGVQPWPTRDPFLFCVHHQDNYPAGNSDFGPQASLAGREIGRDFAGIDGWRMYHGHKVPGFPSHPHRGFETVTVVREGLLDHADSMGAAARYGQGDVQWLTAGSGIQHSEMFPLLRQDRSNPFELFQIWLNLPAKDKFAVPHFSMLWNETIPRLKLVDEKGKLSEITLISGAYGEARPPQPPANSWAAKAENEVAIWSLRMDAGATVILPAVHAETSRSLYFFAGQTIAIADKTCAAGHRLDMADGRPIFIQNASAPAQLLLLAGRPIKEPVVKHGPFVMNKGNEIQDAIRDYRQSHFGGWPWPSHGPVHGPRAERFARFADGRVIKPS